MRKRFFEWLANEMERDPRIYLLVGDLGFGLTTDIEKRFPDRFINVGVAEQLLIGAAVGLTYEDKIAVAYSITPFLLKRPYEQLSLYANGEHAPIKLVGSGRNRDYSREGPTHWCEDAPRLLETLPKIRTFWPANVDDLDNDMMTAFLYDAQPSFISLRK